jgi:PAS domain S-box-containing protein
MQYCVASGNCEVSPSLTLLFQGGTQVGLAYISVFDMIEKLKQIVWNTASSDLPPNHDIEVLRKVVLLNLVLVLGSVFLVLLGSVAFIQGDYVLSILDFGVFLFLIWLFRYLKKTKKQDIVGMIGAVGIGSFYLFLIAYGGIDETAYVWAFTYPLIALFLLGTRLGTLMSFLLLGLVGCLFVLSYRMDVLASYSFSLMIRFFAAYISIFLISYIMEKVRVIVQERLSAKNLELEWALGEVRQKTSQLAELNEGLHQENAYRKRVEKALRDSESFLDDIIESIQDGISVLNPDLTIRHANSVMQKWYGNKTSFIGQKCFVCYQNGDRPCIPCPVLRSLESGKTERDTVPGVSGSMVEWIEVFSFPITDKESGEITGVVEFIRDITSHRKVENEKKQLEAKLQRAQKMEAIGTLAGGVAHDLNNVLSGIVSYPELLLMQVPEDSSMRKPLVTIRESGKKAAAIVQDLLTLARRGVAISDVVNLNDIVTDYFNSPEYATLISYNSHLTVTTDLHEDLMNILGSPVHLSKVVMNLVSNAAEAAPDGGQMIISTENRYVDHPLEGYGHLEEGDYVLLKVSDTGVGIAPEERERIFEPFYTKKVMGRSGTGLGMAVVWGTVKDHKGYIDIQSRVGEGTTVSVYIPATRLQAGHRASALSIEELKGNGESILVVDDVKEQREIATDLLELLGYTVTTAASGEEAVVYMQNNTSDLLILDMIMDGMDGLDTYEQILAMHPNQKAIIASGYSETNRVARIQRLGAGTYIRKPYTLEKIADAIQRELAEKRV